MLLTKAFKFNFKAAADEAASKAGQFAGRASVYGNTDAYGDVVMPGAFDRTLDDLGGKIVVLNQHNPGDPIGSAQLNDSELSLNCVGQLVLELQSAKDMHVRMQNGLIDGISIGYEVIDEAFVGNVRQLKEIKLWEISLCTFPANTFARVTDVKGLMHQLANGDANAQAVLEILPLLKAGRTLSAANRTKLADAISIINEVLATDEQASTTTPQMKAAYEHLLKTIRSWAPAAAKE